MHILTEKNENYSPTGALVSVAIVIDEIRWREKIEKIVLVLLSHLKRNRRTYIKKIMAGLIKTALFYFAGYDTSLINLLITMIGIRLLRLNAKGRKIMGWIILAVA